MVLFITNTLLWMIILLFPTDFKIKKKQMKYLVIIHKASLK